jgi:hypothetical protein
METAATIGADALILVRRRRWCPTFDEGSTGREPVSGS